VSNPWLEIPVSGGQTPIGHTTAAQTAKAIRRDLQALAKHTAPSVRAIRRRYSRDLKQQLPKTVLDVAKALVEDGAWSARFVACELIAVRQDVLRLVDEALIERWARGLADWGSVDMFGVTLAGVAWREGCLSDARVMKWARSRDRWRRRLTLVATVPLNSRARGGDGDARRTLAVCRALADDRDDMVVKALSWALRELAKREPASVSRFMREEESRLASRVRREVRSKLETGRKTQRAG
jgi:3-methyladenine DNA glycosylase AlkD